MPLFHIHRSPAQYIATSKLCWFEGMGFKIHSSHVDCGSLGMLHGWKMAHKLFLGKPEGKRQHRKQKMRWKDNIIWDLKEIGYGGEWKTLAKDSVLIS